MKLSVVVPIFNEEENVTPLHDSLNRVLSDFTDDYEILFVDDGSTDGTATALESLLQSDKNVRVVELRHNFGQTAALNAGIKHADGDVIITIDGDLQNDPADIPAMLQKIHEGYDLVHGWRKKRHDAFLNRRLPSLIANSLISHVTGFPVHDLGCTLKAIRSEFARELELYGEMHRFIPILAHWPEPRCCEIVVNHHPRTKGVSKYGISRTWRVLLDLITVKYLIRYLISPMKLFGSVGMLCGIVGLIAGASTVFMKFANDTDMTGNPLLLLSVFSAMLSVQFFGMGMLSELGARIYFAVRKESPFAVREEKGVSHTEENLDESSDSIPLVSRAA